jgi:hypothetical protein
LDAAILAPSGLAVCLDDNGMAMGVVDHGEIARHLAALPGHMWAGGATTTAGPAITGLQTTPPPSRPSAERPSGRAAAGQLAEDPAAGRGIEAAAAEELTGTTWTTREEPGGSARPSPDAVLPRPVPGAQNTPQDTSPASPQSAPQAAAQTAAPAVAPMVKEAARPTPVVPIPAPAPAPVVRPVAPAKQATVPTIRGGETTTSNGRSANGTVDPVTRWLIGGEEPAAEADEPTAAVAAPVQQAASAPRPRDRANGEPQWEWSSDLGQWVEVLQPRVEPSANGSPKVEDGER